MLLTCYRYRLGISIAYVWSLCCNVDSVIRRCLTPTLASRSLSVGEWEAVGPQGNTDCAAAAAISSRERSLLSCLAECQACLLRTLRLPTRSLEMRVLASLCERILLLVLRIMLQMMPIASHRLSVLCIMRSHRKRARSSALRRLLQSPVPLLD